MPRKRNRRKIWFPAGSHDRQTSIFDEEARAAYDEERRRLEAEGKLSPSQRKRDDGS